jgi:methylenetetrahydrofolate--tRNA-(uracil-5-)-methyltransferase
MHRNTFICSPKLLDNTYALKTNKNIAFAGQITGVEGYIESTASGFLAAVSMFKRLNGKEEVDFTDQTAIGALGYYVSSGSGRNFQPMNVNFGIIAPLEKKVKGGKKFRNEAYALRSLDIIKQNYSEFC